MSASTPAASSSRRRSLTDFVPLYVDDASAGVVSQFDKDDVERAGLVKFDFLGLKTLTIIDWTVAAINEVRAEGATELDITQIAARRRSRVRSAQARRNDRRVPVRITRHARPAEAGEARPVRRHHRARCVVQTGTDGTDSGLHQAQARSGTIRISRSARGTDSVADLRDHGVSGAGHADRSGHRRL